MKYALILASGTGSRMGNTELPKQFLKIGSKPIILHTIEQFTLSNLVDKIIVVVKEEWKNHLQDILDNYNIKNVEIALGGETRHESVKKGCEYIIEKYGMHTDDILITHDAVRPFITHRIIEENIEKIKEYDAVDTVVPAFDTIVKIDDDKIEDIPNRKQMYQGQTPQTFKLKEIYELISSLNEDEANNLTDACKIYLIKNKKIGYVLGEVYNFKITTQYDLNVANRIVRGEVNI